MKNRIIINANQRANQNHKASQSILVKNQNQQLNQIQNHKAIAEARGIILDLLFNLNLILKLKLKKNCKILKIRKIKNTIKLTFKNKIFLQISLKSNKKQKVQVNKIYF